ncbi:thioredoxin-dependent thiol peroxidase [Fontivita pretiosa]|uniref:thioredoxin-dependent thiol peroxidase n=1 Tax=Fontivita pretiosa TaxID=2989684 RepID=UPI003D17D6A2
MSKSKSTTKTAKAAAETLQVGQAAPKFRLASSTGQPIALNDLLGQKMVVIYFYPRADTPGCTTEACGFRDAISEYEKAGVAVVGISPDSVQDVTRFAEKYRLNFPLLADPEHKVAEQYGVWRQKNMYGRTYWGVARTTFVVDRNGKIVQVFQNVKPAGHEQEVLDWIRSHK